MAEMMIDDEKVIPGDKYITWKMLPVASYVEPELSEVNQNRFMLLDHLQVTGATNQAEFFFQIALTAPGHAKDGLQSFIKIERNGAGQDTYHSKVGEFAEKLFNELPKGMFDWIDFNKHMFNLFNHSLEF